MNEYPADGLEQHQESKESINVSELEYSLWETELEIALLTKCDYGTIRNIAKCRPIPHELRGKVWQICLNVHEIENLIDLSEQAQTFDSPQQSKIRDDCQHFVEKLDKSEDEKLSILSNLESIITFYCKTHDELYEKDNGWLDILKPLITLKLKKYELYNLFVAILNRYIPKDCVRNGSPYHLFRLLLLYHDPELCAYLDTKKLTPDSYAHLWVKSLFAASSHLNVALNLWDVYFQLGDQFLIFFLALVLVINAKEQIMKEEFADKHQIINILHETSINLNAEDIEDFCNLAQHYQSQTPQSFRKEYQKSMFDGISLETKASSIYQALCLPVSVSELLQANQLGKGVRYFLVDCRPAEQYNHSHLQTAFHLDPHLMLENQLDFNHAVDTLLAAQRHAIASNSVAGGEHLCFIGSGHDDEDKYVNMVVANFLQRKIKFTSLALGGYETLSKEDPQSVLVTSTHLTSDVNRSKFTEEWIKKISNQTTSKSNSLMNKLSSAMKIGDVRSKIKDYLNTPNQSSHEAKHVKTGDKIGKLYRNQANIFAIDDDVDDAQDVALKNENEHMEEVSVATWLQKSDVLHKFKCFEIKNEKLLPAHLLITNSHIYGLRENESKKGMAVISVRRPLISLVKITSKKNTPEIISFKFGTIKSNSSSNEVSNSSDVGNGGSAKSDEVIIDAIEQFYIPQAGEASKAVKLQVVKILDLMK